VQADLEGKARLPVFNLLPLKERYNPSMHGSYSFPIAHNLSYRVALAFTLMTRESTTVSWTDDGFLDPE